LICAAFYLLLQKIYDSRISTEFDNEVGMLLSIDHLNLVKMIGYMNEHDERILVVEYVPNGNLRQHLDGVNYSPFLCHYKCSLPHGGYKTKNTLNTHMISIDY
jgi:serine/threonine protein kinase